MGSGRGPALRDRRRSRRLCRPRRRNGRCDDLPDHGSTPAGYAGARLRSRRRDAVHEHRPRRRRGCAQRAAISAARLDARGGNRSRHLARRSEVRRCAGGGDPTPARSRGRTLRTGGDRNRPAAAALSPRHSGSPLLLCGNRSRTGTRRTRFGQSTGYRPGKTSSVAAGAHVVRGDGAPVLEGRTAAG